MVHNLLAKDFMRIIRHYFRRNIMRHSYNRRKGPDKNEGQETKNNEVCHKILRQKHSVLDGILQARD